MHVPPAECNAGRLENRTESSHGIPRAYPRAVKNQVGLDNPRGSGHRAGSGKLPAEPSQVGGFLRGSYSLFARGEDRHLASSYGTGCQGDEGRGAVSASCLVKRRSGQATPCPLVHQNAPCRRKLHHGARESGLVALARTPARAAGCSRTTPRGKGGERDDWIIPDRRQPER